jgi:hypothetical protein
VEQEGRTAYLWIVPANVEGTWTCQLPSSRAELTLTQQFQDAQGTLKLNGGEFTLSSVKLQGSQITFVADKLNYSGVVNGGRIEGTVVSEGREHKWSAERTK